MTAPTTLNVRVVRKAVEAEDICSLELAAVDGGPLPAFSAGSHVDVQLPGGLTRQYSLCNDPAETHRYLLGVLKDAASRGGSRAVHEQVQEGSLLQISPPKNHFALAHDAQQHLRPHFRVRQVERALEIFGGPGLVALRTGQRAQPLQAIDLGRPIGQRRRQVQRGLVVRFRLFGVVELLVHSGQEPPHLQLPHLAVIALGQPQGLVQQAQGALRALARLLQLGQMQHNVIDQAVVLERLGEAIRLAKGADGQAEIANLRQGDALVGQMARSGLHVVELLRHLHAPFEARQGRQRLVVVQQAAPQVAQR